MDFETGGLLHISGHARVDWEARDSHDPNALRTIDVTIDAVIDRPAALSLRWSGVVTYHYSCHLRSLGLTDEAEQVLGTIADLDYRRMDKREQCCGFGGTFATKFPEVSGTPVRDKVQQIARTQADTLVCNEAGCGLNISGACRREQVGVGQISLAEILAESLGLLEPRRPE